VPALVPALDAGAASAGPRSARAARDTPAPEVSRQAALDALEMLDTAPEERFDRITRSAKSTFGTAFASVSLVDRERQWHKAVAGPVGSSLELPREVALCHRTIRHDRALVIADLRNDRHVHPDLLAAGWRFYAGYPIESPDGYRIGALCVLDTEPRAGRDVDTVLLRELALRVQREMWIRPDGSVRESLPR
jgi:GAF domain-containing protein